MPMMGQCKVGNVYCQLSWGTTLPPYKLWTVLHIHWKYLSHCLILQGVSHISFFSWTSFLIMRYSFSIPFWSLDLDCNIFLNCYRYNKIVYFDLLHIISLCYVFLNISFMQFNFISLSLMFSFLHMAVIHKLWHRFPLLIHGIFSSYLSSEQNLQKALCDHTYGLLAGCGYDMLFLGDKQVENNIGE